MVKYKLKEKWLEKESWNNITLSDKALGDLVELLKEGIFIHSTYEDVLNNTSVVGMVRLVAGELIATLPYKTEESFALYLESLNIDKLPDESSVITDIKKARYFLEEGETATTVLEVYDGT